MSPFSKSFARIFPLFCLFFLLGTGVAFSQITMSAVAGSPFCAGATFNVNYNATGTFTAGNNFRVELSTAAGTFPGTTIGNVATTTAGAGTILATIPVGTTPGASYTIRVNSTAPPLTSTSQAITINAAPTIAAPTFTPTVFCQGDTFTINYTVTCSFNTLASTNVFTAVLSNPAGSFASGTTTIGNVTATTNGTITATIPSGTTAGTTYRIRITSSNPSGIASPNNGTDLTVNATAGVAGAAGSNLWQVSCYNGTAFTNYYGFYTETALNFDTQTRWDQNTTPSNATAGTGVAYTGCPIPVDNHSYRYRRTGFPCGYYQINIPTHDDQVDVIINGATVFTHNGCCDAHTNVWTGFLGAASTVEIALQEGAGQSYLSATFAAAPNPLITSTPPTVCVNTNSTLTVSSALTLTYSWALISGNGTAPSPTTGTTVVVQASAGTNPTYRVTATDATTTCTTFKDILVTKTATPSSIVISPSSAILCPANPSVTLTASGANTYSWSPGTGLNTTTGSVVVATPSVTTTYTVSGTTGGCALPINGTVTVSVPTILSPSVFPSGQWNAYVFVGTNFSSQAGSYTTNALSFNTTSQWAAASGPSSATATGGTAYAGCNVGTSNYSISYKRTGFTCGAVNANYFQIDIPSHDDDINLLINGASVYSFTGAGSGHTNVWTGFLGPASTVEFQLANTTGATANLQVTIAPSVNRPLIVNPPITVCSGTTANLLATSSISGVTYAWTPSAGLSSPGSAATFSGSLVSGQTFTATLTDAGNTNCTANATVPVTVSPTSTTTVTQGSSVTLTCPGQGITLTASGANNYTWSPGTGLSATTGYSVVATPTVTTIYTVSGNNNCGAPGTSTTTVTVNVPFPAVATFPTNTWNAYGFNDLTFTDYRGAYTDNGSGTTGYDFDTRLRWTTAPSTAVVNNGTAWAGCSMNQNNISLSFKRTNFTCGIYTIDIPYHDDDFLLYINSVLVASHTPGCCDTHTAIWTGELSTSSKVEFRLMQGGGAAGLAVTFTRAAAVAGQNIWTGDTDTNWFTASNWCSAAPTTTTDALIPSAGPPNMPAIGGAGAVVRNITINPAIAAGTYNAAIAAASLTTTGTNGLSVSGNWTNNGSYVRNTGTITFSGSAATVISGSTTQTFHNLIFNKSNTTTNTSTLQVANSATFTNGVVIQSSTFEFLVAGSVSGANNNSYVDGPVRKTGTSAFIFPVGDNGFYRPLSISAPSSTDQLEAQYFNTDPNPLYNVGSKDVTLDHVSRLEYWTFLRNSGAANVTVNLTWGSNSGVTSPLTDLRVTGWNGTTWKDQGNGGIPGGSTSTSGSVFSGAAVSLYGPYSLASITANNPLPIELIDFVARYDAGVVLVSWKTESELNNDYFIIQRTSNVESFEDLIRVKGAGTSAEKHSYSSVDEQPLPGKSYYRLQQTDFDKKTILSNIVSVLVPESVARKAYPNPSNGSDFTVSFSKNDVSKNAVIKLTDIEGKEMFQVMVENINSTAVKVNVPQKLTSGVYILSIAVGQEVARQRLVVR